MLVSDTHTHTHTHRCICEYVYTYIMEHYSVIKGSDLMAFAATWMDLKIVLLSEVSQTEKRQISYDCSYMWDLKNWCNISRFQGSKNRIHKKITYVAGGTHVYPWLIHINVWQKPPQCCKVITLQLK